MTNNPDQDFKVADLSLAPWGRKEIELAEVEMPGLMALRAEFTDSQAARRRPHHRLAAHDDPDRGAHRDPDRARRRGALGELQHLLHPGPRRRRRRGRPEGTVDEPKGVPGVRLEGRDARGVLVVHRAGAALARRRRPQHDPRRRRRRHAARAQGRRVREGRRRARRHRRRPRGVAASSSTLLKRSLAEDPSRWTTIASRHQGRHRGDHHRRPPALPDVRARASCCSRPSTSTTRSPSRSSTTSTAAATASSTASTAAPT